MKKTVCACFFVFLCPLGSFAVPLGLRIQALYNKEAQFQMGVEMEIHEKNIPKAKAFYLKAVDQRHPDAANRLAVLLEREGEIHEAIKYHELAVEWYGENAHEGFSPLPDIHPSRWNVYYDREVNYEMWFTLPSSGAHSALSLAKIYRKKYDDLLIIPSKERIKKSDLWYKKASDLHTPAVFIGVSLFNFYEEETALQWFALALKESIDIPFVHYKMGGYYAATLGDYYQAIASYRKAMRFESKTERDYRFAALAAVRLGEIYHQGIKGKISANSELSESFYKKAFQIGKNGWHSIAEHRLEKETSTDILKQLKIKGGAAKRVGVARHIANAYQKAHLFRGNPADLNLALRWLTIAHNDQELSRDQYRQDVIHLSLQVDASVRSRVSAQSESPVGACEHALEK